MKDHTLLYVEVLLMMPYEAYLLQSCSFIISHHTTRTVHHMAEIIVNVISVAVSFVIVELQSLFFTCQIQCILS